MSFINNQNVKIVFVNNELALDDVTTSLNKNTIILTKYENESEVNALFRYLRNAFTHFRINHSGNEYLLSDINRDGSHLTMKGRIEVNKLRRLIFLILEIISEH